METRTRIHTLMAMEVQIERKKKEKKIYLEVISRARSNDRVKRTSGPVRSRHHLISVRPFGVQCTGLSKLALLIYSMDHDGFVHTHKRRSGFGKSAERCVEK